MKEKLVKKMEKGRESRKKSRRRRCCCCSQFVTEEWCSQLAILEKSTEKLLITYTKKQLSTQQVVDVIAHDCVSNHFWWVNIHVYIHVFRAVSS